MNKVLVVEDDAAIRGNVLDLLEAEGYEGLGAADGEAGVALAVKHLPDLIICDVMMPGVDGYEVLEVLSARAETAVIPFIFLSARAERADVRRGMALGADDYLTKPFTRVELLDAIEARLRRRRTQGSEPAAPKLPTSVEAPPRLAQLPAHIVLEDPVMRALFVRVERVAKGPISVLVLGETGVGKEVVAERVHSASERSGRFVAVNCAALPESLLESELFGHERGAFTGATSAKPGLFESAHGGTLFLDEVGELPPTTQVKLLRVLETRSVLRLGSREPRPVDVRFVSATHRDIEQEQPGQVPLFRRDLYFRLSGITLFVPPLRERRADIDPLIATFIASSLRSRGSVAGQPTSPVLSPEARALMEAYTWPGNIRELRNVIERAVLLCEGPQMQPEHLSLPVRDSNVEAGVGRASASVDPRTRLLNELEQLERQRIIDTLARCAGNQTLAAEKLGISRRTLVTRLRDYDLPRPRRRLLD